MKKFLIYFFSFIFICFILPAICTVRTEKVNSQVQEETNKTTAQATEETKQKDYEYKKYAKIKLLHTKTNQIEEIPIDGYLYNVVSAEMPASYELEALKAQAVVARTYTIYQISHSGGKHENADLCDSSLCCQAWITKDDRFARWEESERESNWNKIVNAVDSTTGIVVTYNGEPIDAFFHSNSGGTTETATNVWGGENYPYLQSVQTSGEEGYTQYSSEVILTQDELLNKLKEKHSEVQIDFNNNEDIKIIDYTESGRVKTIKFGNVEISGVETRTTFGLKSANFEISREDNKIKFTVKGYGHGVGMSQTGADSLAKSGSNYEEIVKHFYTGVELKDINSL